LLALASMKPVYLASSHGGFSDRLPDAMSRGDADLASRVAIGDRDALAELFRDHGGPVKTVAYRVLRDDALADDIVQDTFVSFWRSPEKFDPARGSLRTYLLTIAHRRAVDVVRSETARSRREQRPPDPDHFDLEEEVWVRALSEEVRTALLGLSDAEREAIGMAYLGGFSYVEVAERLGAPEGTVKSRIRSGMKKLASELEGVAT
jgi:RNA polymerase sigma-70 factor, ECF subfamily